MLRFAFSRNYVVINHLNGLRRVHNPDLPKNILFGGHLSECPYQQSLGQLIFERLTDPNRADKILQICPDSGKSMTTQTFVQQSVAVAEGLRKHNIDRGDFVLLMGSNGLNMNIALIGVLLMGAVAVPISTDANSGDLRHLLALIRPKFFICESQILFTLRRIINSVLGPIEQNNIFLLNDTKNSASGLQCFPEFIEGKGENWKSFTPSEVKAPKEDLVFVMKSLSVSNARMGIGLTHYNLLNVIWRYESMKEDLSTEVILMVQKIIWMSGIYSLLLSCCFGPKLVVISHFDEESFLKCIETYRVTTTFLYPAKIWQIYKHKFPTSYDLSSCRRIYVVGIGIPQILIQLMKEKTGLILEPVYGKSEMSGIVVEPIKDGIMGQLVPMCYAKVVSLRTKEICGPNTPGEFCFKGPTLMKGYVHDEQATRNAIDKDGFFHTGDYGYYDEEGHILLLDKIKWVMRYKDHEISPLEIEGVLKSHDSVKDCVVSGILHPEDGHRLIAFVVLQPGVTATADEIVKFVEGKLPEHKHLKGGVVFLPKVPRSRESGYLNRNMISKVLSKYKLMQNPGAKEKSRGEMDAQEQTKKQEGAGGTTSPQVPPGERKTK